MLSAKRKGKTMDIKEAFESYLRSVSDENRNITNIACDEMNSKQYEEAAVHFDQIYVKDSAEYMPYFFRAYCKSLCGVRGNAEANAQKITSAFTMACQKALSVKRDFEADMILICHHYIRAMEILANCAVDGITKGKIESMARDTMIAAAEEYRESIKMYPNLEEYLLSYLKEIEHHNLEEIGALIVSYDSSYEAVYQDKLKKKKKKLIIILGIAIFLWVVGLLVGFIVSGAK